MGFISIHQLILNADNAASRFTKIRIPAYISEKILMEGTGAYTSEEWSQARVHGYRNAREDSSALNNDEKYLSRIFQTQYRNFLSAQRLCCVHDFTQYDSVIELGCGEMVQAFVITKLYPHIRYRATDFDPYIIEKCSRLSLLSEIEKDVLDVSDLNAIDLKGSQLVLSWELLYALDESKLIRLFEVVGAAGASMIACTTQLTGPLRVMIRRLKGIPGDQKINRDGVRMHGWYPAIRIRNQDNFTFLYFVPR